MASIELNIKTNAKGAIEGLKATDANIRKVSDTLVKLQNDLDPKVLTDDFEKLNGLIERNAKSLLDSSKAADIYEARLRAIRTAMESAMQMKGGDNAKIVEYLKQLEQEAVKAQGSITKFAEVSEKVAGGGSEGGFLGKLASKFVKTTFQVTVFRTVMKATQLIVKTFNKVITDGIKNASQSEQVYSKLNTVFGEYNDNLSVAVELSQKIGTSTQTAASALSTVGDLLQAQGAGTAESLKMATEWVEQFQDIIAFKDIDMSLEEFAQNFMSGAAGNLRNFRTFGSIVKESAVQARLLQQGLDKLVGSELELAKMTARAEIALEQQKNAIGATEREWDTMLSINRRVDEQWKQFTENIGNEMIPALKTVKSWWASILETSNKAALSQKQYASGKKDIKVYNLTDNKDDWNRFETELVDLLYTEGSNRLDLGFVFNTLREEMTRFGATAEDTLKVINDNKKGLGFTEDQLEKIVAEIKALDAELKKARETERAVEKMASDINTAAESADNFVEAMSILRGVNLTSSWADITAGLLFDTSNYKGLGKDYSKMIAESLVESIDFAIEQLGSTNADTYKNLVSVVFGDDQALDSLEAWKKEIEDLYTVLYNRQITNGDVTDTQLNNVISLWKDAEERIKRYNDELERQKNLSASISQFINSASGYRQNLAVALSARDLESTGMGSERAMAIASAKYQFQVDSKGLKGQEYVDLKNAYNDSIRAITAWFDDVEALAEEQQRKTSYESSLSSLQGSGSNLAVLKATRGYINSGYTSEYASALASFLSGKESLTATYNEGLKNASTDAERQALYQEWANSCEQMQIEFNEQTADMTRTVAEQQKKAYEEMMAEVWNSLGQRGMGYTTTGGIISTITDGKGDIWTDLITIILDLAEKCKNWATLLELVDEILDPLIIAITYIVDILVDVLKPALEVIQVILKVVASGVTMLAGAIDYAWTFIEATFKKGIGTIVNGFWDMVQAIANIHIGGWYPFKGAASGRPEWASKWAGISIGDELNKSTERTNTLLEKIWNESIDINENTKSDYGTYQDLYKRGMLSEKNYLSLIRGTNYSSTISGAGVSLQKSGNTTYLAMNGLTINLPGVTNAQEFIDYMERFRNGEVGMASRAIA